MAQSYLVGWPTGSVVNFGVAWESNRESDEPAMVRCRIGGRIGLRHHRSSCRVVQRPPTRTPAGRRGKRLGGRGQLYDLGIPWRQPLLPAGALRGSSITLDAFRGQVLFINMWATWCGPCVRELASIQALAESMKDSGVAFLLVSPEDPEVPRNGIRIPCGGFCRLLERGDGPASPAEAFQSPSTSSGARANGLITVIPMRSWPSWRSSVRSHRDPERRPAATMRASHQHRPLRS